MHVCIRVWRERIFVHNMSVCMCVCMCMSHVRTHTCALAKQERDREELGVWRIEWEEEMQSGAASSGR